jgi:hypothetical protein
MKRYLAVLCTAGFLSGCAHEMKLVDRQSGAVGTASVTTAGNHSGSISISLNGKTYLGTWVYAPTGGALGFSDATATSGTATATGYGTMAMLPTGGGGSILATAPDGSRIHCTFQYSEFGRDGLGVCQDNKGATYDLQIM